MCVSSALPLPNVSISFSGNSKAGQNYSLDCSAIVVEGLMVEPDIEIVFLDSTLQSVRNTSFAEHSFSPLKTSDGGNYTCTATVTIPEANVTNITHSAVENITVASKSVNQLFTHYSSVSLPQSLN